MPKILMSVIGDCHIGTARRNKWLYEKSHEAFHQIIKDIGSNRLAVAGDLWDTESPKPYDLVFIQDEIDKASTVVIPGNHDRVLMDGICAAQILNNAYVYKEPEVESFDCGIVVHYVPYITDMADRLKEHTNSFDFSDGKKHILISHFSLAETNSFAGIFSERDPIFFHYDQVIVADSHVCYDNGKFHTTGSTYFVTIDEMYSPRSFPSYVNIMSDGSVERITYPKYKPVVINSEIEAVDDDKLYLIVSSDGIPTVKPNVVVKHMGGDGREYNGESSLVIDESISLQGGINKDKFFALAYPEMSKEDLLKLKNYEAGVIEIEDLVSENESPKMKDDGSADEAVLSGLMLDDFEF